MSHHGTGSRTRSQKQGKKKESFGKPPAAMWLIAQMLMLPFSCVMLMFTVVFLVALIEERYRFLGFFFVIAATILPVVVLFLARKFWRKLRSELRKYKVTLAE